ncbi:MAG: HAMP domain-containing histidine kinase [Clostridia bacterium]|nr:HAMP domain-containing histidine kinase [Clostridia bacterium]
MDKLHLKPYTFRSRMMIALYICTALAGVISLIFAYIISHFNLQSEMTIRQQAVAVYLLEMEQMTDLTLEEMIHMAEIEDITISQVSVPFREIPTEAWLEMQSRTIYTYLADMGDMPVTYVQLQDTLLCIDAPQGENFFLLAFFRVIFAVGAYLAVFVLMITFVTTHLTRPVAKLTEATTRLQQGDFDYHLPDNVPGEMGELMRSFNDMTEALGRTAYLQKDFISSVSHEFKTPIASIRGFAKLLQMPGLTEEQRAEYVNLIAQESDRLSRLSETLLRLTALEQQTAPASLSTFSLDEQLRQVILRLEPTWSARDIGWQIDCSEVSITSDEALLSHVWVNLIQNAIKFSPEGSDIEVRVFMKDAAVVEIQDHGCGMDEKTVERIFDRFYQADRSRRQEGVGLGLSLVKRILVILGGEITVQSVPGRGSTFRVTLPMKPPRHTHMEEQLNA